MTLDDVMESICDPVPLCTGGAGAGRAGRYLRRLHDPGRHRELVRQETGHTAEVIATCVAESFRETLTGLRE